MINEEMRKKKDGLTLGEQITKSLEKAKSKQAVSLIDDSFFKEEVEGATTFYVRRTNLLREDGRFLNIVDEQQVELKRQAEEEAKQAKRDQTFDEFKSKYDEHIEGKAVNLRIARQSNFGEDLKS